MSSPKDGLEPQSAAALDCFDSFKADWMERIEAGGIAVAREYAHEVFTHFRHPERDVEPAHIEDIHVPTATGKIPARLYCGSAQGVAIGSRAAGTALFMHGGGWSLGGLDAYDGLVGSLAALSGFDFISLDYSLAPEHPFPTALEQCDEALQWVTNEMAPGPLAVIGDSAGGNLAAVLARRSAARGGHALAAQVLLYPMIDIASPGKAYASRVEYGNGDLFLDREGIEGAALAYVGERTQCRKLPDVSPIFGALSSDLAPAFILTAALDPLRDEAVGYHERLQVAGVPSEHLDYEGTFHAFMSFGALDRAQEARRDVAGFLRRLKGDDQQVKA